MKKVIKINLAAIFTLLLACTLASFKVAGSFANPGSSTRELSPSVFQSNWYSVEANGQDINPTADPSAPDNCEGSSEIHCAIEISVLPGNDFPETVAEAYQMEADELLIIGGERFWEE